jgi:7-cyano-7-deazaguanine reductase
MQPDFGILIIDYIPKNWLVESKSFKIYIQSYRNYGIFHEEAVMKVGVDLFKSIKPVWFRIAGYFAPRGGIPIDVFWQSSKKPNNLEIPELKNFERKLFNR